MRPWAFAPLGLLVALIVVAAYVLTSGAPRQTVSAGLVGQPVPAMRLERLAGGAAATNEAMAGRAHLVNLFASWCGPCRAEHRVLAALEAEGVAVLGVAYKDAPEKAAAFLGELGDPYADVLLDPEGRYGVELGITGVPETFVIGADGRIRAVHRGPLTPDVVRDEIMPALAEGGP